MGNLNFIHAFLERTEQDMEDVPELKRKIKELSTMMSELTLENTQLKATIQTLRAEKEALLKQQDTDGSMTDPRG